MKKEYKVIFSPEALADLQDSIKWYNQQQKGLGKKLVVDVQQTTILIRNNPFYASLKYASFRVAYCKSFPYGIHYYIQEESKTVFVTSIFHFSRKPFWLNIE